MSHRPLYIDKYNPELKMQFAILVLVLGLFGDGYGSTAPYLFPVAACTACHLKFGELEIDLKCMNDTFCKCEWEPPGDAHFHWEIKGRDRTNNCTVSKFGPCGELNGIKIGCFGMNCEKNVCTDGKESSDGQVCAVKKHCKKDLTCNKATYKCIRPKSTKDGDNCGVNEDCQSGNCVHDDKDFGFSPSTCKHKGSGGFLITTNFWLVVISLP